MLILGCLSRSLFVGAAFWVLLSLCFLSLSVLALLCVCFRCSSCLFPCSCLTRRCLALCPLRSSRLVHLRRGQWLLFSVSPGASADWRLFLPSAIAFLCDRCPFFSVSGFVACPASSLDLVWLDAASRCARFGALDLSIFVAVSGCFSLCLWALLRCGAYISLWLLLSFVIALSLLVATLSVLSCLVTAVSLSLSGVKRPAARRLLCPWR